MFFSVLFAAATLTATIDPQLEDLELELEEAIEDMQEIVFDESVDEEMKDLSFDFDEEDLEK